MSSPDSTHSLSVATVGTKGQIVIPLEVRERLGIGPGDKIVVMMRDKHAAVLLPMDGMSKWLNKMTADFDELKELMNNSKDD
jgi:AbrB family looped-hinge helix DNA binding protein